MCVILHAARRSLISRQEILAAMQNNSAGFFIAELRPGGKRKVIRTMSQEDALSFLDNTGIESEIVAHFRIPSCGEMSLDNVHGWSSDRIMFCHNRTLHNLLPSIEEESWSRTDSEYFFKKVFIPLYRKLGGFGKAYRRGRLCPLLDRVVRGICGDYNKFLFIMPDNAVLRYGEWEGNDESRPGFYASNMSYLEDPSDVESANGDKSCLSRFLNYLCGLIGMRQDNA